MRTSRGVHLSSTGYHGRDRHRPSLTLTLDVGREQTRLRRRTVRRHHRIQPLRVPNFSPYSRRPTSLSRRT